MPPGCVGWGFRRKAGGCPSVKRCCLVLGPELTSWAVTQANRGAGLSADSCHSGSGQCQDVGASPPQGPVMSQSGQRTEGGMDGRAVGTGTRRPDSDLDMTLAPRLSSHGLPRSIRGGGCWMDPQRDGGVPPKGQVRVLMPGAGRGPPGWPGPGGHLHLFRRRGCQRGSARRVIPNSQRFIPCPVSRCLRAAGCPGEGAPLTSHRPGSPGSPPPTREQDVTPARDPEGRGKRME